MAGVLGSASANKSAALTHAVVWHCVRSATVPGEPEGNVEAGRPVPNAHVAAQDDMEDEDQEG